MDEKDLQEIDKISVNKETKMKKFWVIVTLLLVLLIPVGFMHGIIEDRENYKQEAVNKVATSWGNAQHFKSPSLRFKDDSAKELAIKYLTLYNYNADVRIQTEIRKKGFFKIPVYTANVLLKGTFKNSYGNLTGKKMILEIGVSDSRGFLKEPSFKIANKPEVLVTGMEHAVLINSAPDFIPFEISYSIRGLNELFLNIGGQTNNVKISGNWVSPSFEGDFLPMNRKIENGNFEAEWATPKIATLSLDNPKVGVSLLLPVDNYRMADRTLKYAFLFLSLTFLSYFIFELTSNENKKIHPLQYCLLGGAMLVFYLLLVSLSEFLAFNLSYIISAMLIITLISFYTYTVIGRGKSKKFPLLITSLMIILYAFLYTLLLLEDFSLLLGSFGMFAIIAIVMFSTRNINWYLEN